MILTLSFIFGFSLACFLLYLKFGTIKEYQDKVLHATAREQENLTQSTLFALKEKELQLKSELKIEEETRKFKLQRMEIELKAQQAEASEKLKKLEKKEKELLTKEKQLFHIAQLSEAEVKEHLFRRYEKEAQHLATIRLQEIEEQAERAAQKIVATAIQRISLPSLNSLITTGVPIDAEDVKAKVVGKEGRNIRTFEELTGTTLLMDDSPHSILISCFDPIRREIATRALKVLIAEGKIYPSRIEEVVHATKSKVEEITLQKGEEGAARAGVFGLHPNLIKLLGKLHFRYSLGQNLLDHSIEVSYFLGLIADELGLKSPLARRIGLLHDIGKAIEEQKGKSHALAGMDFARSHGEPEEVCNGIGCHHFEVEAATLEGSLCHVADSLSASRPGSRQDKLETYVKRMKELELAATEVEGVEKVYALQMGKEIRIVVRPEWNNDTELKAIARSVKEKVNHLSLNRGQVKLTLCCETKFIEMI